MLSLSVGLVRCSEAIKRIVGKDSALIAEDKNCFEMDNLFRAVASATCDFKYRSKPSPSSSVIPVSNLVDPDATLLQEIESTVARLDIKFRQKLSLMVEELRKNLRCKANRRNVIKCNRDHCNPQQNQQMATRCGLICEAAAADVVVCSEEEVTTLEEGCGAVPVSEMIDYSESTAESKRKQMLDLEPTDALSATDFDDMMARATRYSVWLRIYDKQIGHANNLSNFRRGIERIVKIWLENAHFAPQQLQIFTVEDERSRSSDDKFTAKRKADKNRVANAKLRTQLLEPLKAIIANTSLKVVQEPRGAFHARHLQTQTINVQFDKGFDFIDDRGNFNRNFLSVANSAQEHLRQFRTADDSRESDFAP